MKNLKKAQFGIGSLMKAGAKAAAKAAPKAAKAAKKIGSEAKSAITSVERNALKKRFQDIDKGLDKTSSPSEKISKAVNPKPKMQAGGVVKSAKRVGPVDPDGAWTKVQERTLAGAKVKKVPLTKDKELDASAVERKQAGDVAKNGKWIQKAIKKPGALRAQLGAKKGEPIPAGKLAAAAKKGGKLGQRARLAQTLKKMKK
jgi:hypothetical protein